MKDPIVSVIVPTYNSEKFIDDCLISIKNQTYNNIELIVVDNNSTDRTKEIANKYTNKLFNQGPERSWQRNYGLKKAKGEYCLFIDSDMKLSKEVVNECVKKIKFNQDITGIIIPEESFGQGFWAECKKLERSYYVGIDWIEAARFFKIETILKIKGYDPQLISGEDWDLSQRAEKTGLFSRIDAYIYHNEGNLKLFQSIKKKFYYAKNITSYTNKHTESIYLNKQTSLFQRYLLFFSHPRKLFSNPVYGLGMLFMKTTEFIFGTVGYLIGLYSHNHEIIQKEPLIKEYFKISFIIPTYNAEKYLDKCLLSIYKQEYPKENIEVIIIDGGSIDSTLEITAKYPVKLIKNDRIIAEYGKTLGIKESTGDYFVLLDSDNEIVERDWLERMLKPIINHPEIFGVESPLSHEKPLKMLNRYFARMRIADPLARLLASKPEKVLAYDDYKILSFPKKAILITGANGFLWNKKMIMRFNQWKDKFEEANFSSYLHEQNSANYAIPENASVRHMYCEDLLDYMRKRKKIALKVKQRVKNKEYMWIKNNSKLKIVLAILYLGTVIGPFIECLYLNIRYKTFDYIYYPVISFLTIWIYGWTIIKNKA